MLKITFVLTQAAAGAVEGDSHASTCSRLRCHIFAVDPHPGVWLSTHGEVAVHCEGHYLKGPVIEHGCHRQTERALTRFLRMSGAHTSSRTEEHSAEPDVSLLAHVPSQPLKDFNSEMAA